MSFQIISDLHLESEPQTTILKNIPVLSEILVMAGDIGSFYDIDPILELLREACSKFKHVIYVPGNHEYYSLPRIYEQPKTIGFLLHRFKSAVKVDPKLKGVYVLSRDIASIGDLVFVGTTLWSDPSPLKRLPSYVKLGIGIRKYHDLHVRDKTWLNRISKIHKGKKLIVVTHHAPSMKLLQDNNFIKKYGSLYATDLSHTEAFKNATVWVHGHTHNNMDITLGNTRIISNQQGKSLDSCEVNHQLVITP